MPPAVVASSTSGTGGSPRSCSRGRPGGQVAGVRREGRTQAMSAFASSRGERARLRRRGLQLEYTTLAWNVLGVVVLGITAVAARSVALAGFGLDSLIEIAASTVVIWELSDAHDTRRRPALRLIASAFIVLALYLFAQSTWVLATGHHAHHSIGGIAWTAITAAVMFALAAGKARTGARLGNPVLQAEGRVTFVDGILAAAVLLGLLLNALLGWWWADPAASYVLVFYAAREARAIFREQP